MYASILNKMDAIAQFEHSQPANYFIFKYINDCKKNKVGLFFFRGFFDDPKACLEVVADSQLNAVVVLLFAKV